MISTCYLLNIPLKFIPLISDQLPMKITKVVVIFTILLISTSCARRFNIARVTPGLTSTSQAIKYLSEPQYFDHSAFNSREEILIWDDVTLQTNDDVVTAVHRTPASHESSLQFWRQHYKQSTQNFSKVNNRFESGEHIWQLNLPQHGINVVYDESLDKVVKVIYYYVE
jgi:hypothetical protein